MLSSTLPNTLTLSRIMLIPLVVLGFYLASPVGWWTAFLAYTCACITDFFDGYMARLWSQTSRLGQFLDPIADKLLVVSSLVLLVGFNHLSQAGYIPALIIISREILVSGLREFLSQVKVNVRVTFLAKWKTFIQMFSIGTLLIAPVFSNYPLIYPIGEGLLWIAALITVRTGYDYCRIGLPHILEHKNTSN